MSCLLLAWSPALLAAPLSSEQTLQAEQLGEQGVIAYQEGRYDAARQDLERGYEISSWGTIGVWLGKTYEKLDLPEEAYRIYAQVASEPAIEGEAQPFSDARREAQQALTELVAQLAVLELVGSDFTTVSVSADGQTRQLTKQGTFALRPGVHVVAITGPGIRLKPMNLTLQAGETQAVSLDASTPAGVDSTAKTKPAVVAGKSPPETPVVQTLNLNHVETQGWSLHDESGKVICQLPCQWSGTEAEALTVRQGDISLPLRLSRRWRTEPKLDVTVNPKRGSKAWALGLGIPSGVLFFGSIVGLQNADYSERASLSASTALFGAGFGACAWWFIWSKSRPYLSYDQAAEPEQQVVGVQLSVRGNGLGVKATF